MYFPDAREAPPGIFLARPERVGAGLRLAVKDLFDSAALTTTYGSAIFAEHVPGRSAEAILRLGRAGYALTAKANLHEFAWGITSENPHFGDVPNPLAPDRIAGGSSGGCAAALVAGFVDAALGTDSAGSIRIPSACCGTVGFKPTHGLVSLEGCFPLAPSFDHAGPMARDVAGCEAMMEALVPGFEPRELSSFDGLEVGALWIDEADPGVRARIVEALALMPGAHSADLPTAAPCYAAFMPEAADVHRELYREQGGLYGRNVATKVERALAFTVEQGEAGRRARGEYRRLFRDLMSSWPDLLVAPTLACVAPPTGIGDLALRERLIRFTFPFNAVGAPALALPCGAAENGLPASLQLVGRPGEDALVLAAGRLLERLIAGLPRGRGVGRG